MSEEHQSPADPEADGGASSRGQRIGAAVLALMMLVGVAWALDWYTSSAFWRGVVRFTFEIISHLGK